MAILSNDRVGPGYLAVELTVDKRLHPIGPLTRGPVVSWGMPDEAYELIKALGESLVAERLAQEPDPDSVWPPITADWPPVDRAKIGWLNCTVKFIVAESVIYQQGLLVQYATFREWYYLLDMLLATEHTEDRHMYSGVESPELRMHLIRSYIDPVEWDYEPEEEGDVYGHSLAIHVDTSMIAGEPTVSGEGPGMFFYPKGKALLAFAQQLWHEAETAG
jgi:hypothetical protein